MNCDEKTSSFFSIVVPVYNASKWLNDTLGSVLSQDFDNWELILVDDGSTDDSYLILEDFASKDKRIKAISQKNSGVSAARNRGLQYASGEYVIFLDADDMLSENALSTYFNVITSHPDVEVIKGSHFVKSFDKLFETRFAQNRVGCEDKLYKGPQFLENMAWYHCVIYAYCYKMSFLKANKLQFIEGASYLEDGAFIVSVLRIAKCCYYTPKCTYVYRYQESTSSLSNSISINKLDGFCKVLVSFKSDIANSSSDIFKKYVSKMLSMHGYHLISLTLRNPRSERKALFEYIHSTVGQLPIGGTAKNKVILFLYNRFSFILSL